MRFDFMRPGPLFRSLRLPRIGLARIGLAEVGLALCLLALAPLPLPHLHPLHAQSAPDIPKGKAETEKGFSLMEEGAKLLLRGLMNEMEPSIAELEGALREIAPEIEAHIDALGPQLSELAKLMQDVKSYDMPVMLENGDILIRRKVPLPPESRENGRDGETAPESPAPRGWPPAPGPNGEIEL